MITDPRSDPKPNPRPTHGTTPQSQSPGKHATLDYTLFHTRITSLHYTTDNVSLSCLYIYMHTTIHIHNHDIPISYTTYTTFILQTPLLICSCYCHPFHTHGEDLDNTIYAEPSHIFTRNCNFTQVQQLRCTALPDSAIVFPIAVPSF